MDFPCSVSHSVSKFFSMNSPLLIVAKLNVSHAGKLSFRLLGADIRLSFFHHFDPNLKHTRSPFASPYMEILNPDK